VNVNINDIIEIADNVLDKNKEILIETSKSY
jgi:hypothetical protein